MALIRQFLVLGWLVTDNKVQTNINMGRLRISTMSLLAVGGLLMETVNYNLGLLEDDDNDTDGIPSSKKDTKLGKLVLLGRVCQRETPLKWRHIFCERFGLETLSHCCQVCGLSYPRSTCARCKWKGGTLTVHYCGRAH